MSKLGELVAIEVVVARRVAVDRRVTIPRRQVEAGAQPLALAGVGELAHQVVVLGGQDQRAGAARVNSRREMLTRFSPSGIAPEDRA